MTDSRKTTERGFSAFGSGHNSHQLGEWRVKESSIAFCGAHCWVFCSITEEDTKLDTRHQAGDSWDIHVDVSGARELIAALQRFIDSAESGELMEPAS